MAPPPNNDEHGCAWRDYARELEQEAVRTKARMDEMEAKLELLQRNFERRSEAKKMPKIPRPPRTAEEVAERRMEQELLRAEKIVVDETAIPVPEAMKTCPLCSGSQFRNVGIGKTSVTWHYVAAHFRKHVHIRETVACRCGGCVITAPKPERWSEKTRYDSSFVSHIVVSKCLMVTPLYRLEQSFARLGIPIARSSMNDLFRRAGQKLEPLSKPLFDAIKNDYLVNVDETTFTMTKQTSKAFIWAFVGRSLTGYKFALSRGGDVPVNVLGDSSGVIVCDDYRGYDPLARKGFRIRAGCLAHARRKFFEAGDVPEAQEALSLIGVIYTVEHEAERRNVVGKAEHLALRREFSRPLFIHLVRLVRKLRLSQGPKTLLGRAASYLRSNVRELGRAMRDARIPLDNNRAENALRVVALGRKNFLFVHSKESGDELALLYSLVVSCTRLGVNPVAYIADVLDRIDKTPADRYAELLPDRWKPPAKSSTPRDPVVFDE